MLINIDMWPTYKQCMLYCTCYTKESAKIYGYTIKAVVRGYHVYEAVWEVTLVKCCHAQDSLDGNCIFWAGIKLNNNLSVTSLICFLLKVSWCLYWFTELEMATLDKSPFGSRNYVSVQSFFVAALYHLLYMV